MCEEEKSPPGPVRIFSTFCADKFACPLNWTGLRKTDQNVKTKTGYSGGQIMAYTLTAQAQI